MCRNKFTPLLAASAIGDSKSMVPYTICEKGLLRVMKSDNYIETAIINFGYKKKSTL